MCFKITVSALCNSRKDMDYYYKKQKLKAKRLGMFLICPMKPDLLINAMVIQCNLLYLQVVQLRVAI